ncbi:MAG: L,D-transpeptidase family protein [Bacteroidota bacterium]|nr:L,D-transpeptidase family protein [Bacteroidota bacterium]
MKIVCILLLTLMLSAFMVQTDFLTEQKKFERVRTAINDKGIAMLAKLKQENIRPEELNILIKAYKEEQEFEIYAKNKSDNKYKKILSYSICSSSGRLGPKRKQGDFQVPEGFYHIDRFNPVSNYYLSLGINYPNLSDRKKSSASNLGGDIFLHGECVTVGCLPMTTDKIKEIYIYAIQARHSGQLKIPVYIFPFKMTDENFEKHKTKYSDNFELISFWTNLKTGYDKFEKELTEVKITVDKQGNYLY